MSNVKNYTDQQILNRVNSLPSFKGFPPIYWLGGVRSNEDAFNEPDDKFYLFKGEQFVKVFPGTTNAGSDLLKPTNPRGVGVIKADEIYYDVWGQGWHHGKVWAWKQVKAFLIHRDNDRDQRTEELGVAKLELGGFNFHPMSYVKGSTEFRYKIGPWSIGCQCPAVRSDFDEVMTLTFGQKNLSYALLREW